MTSLRLEVCALVLILFPGTVGSAAASEPVSPGRDALTLHVDAPLLFVKRFNYLGIHIYDTFYKWRPGGGIYVIENPAAPRSNHRIRPLVDPGTPESPGPGMYSDPDVSWDGMRVLFCHKASQNGSTSIYEVRVDGTGLRRLTDPSSTCDRYCGSHGGQHDVTPAYLPDGRILFTSTRPSGLVPCANEGVNILHVMERDGSEIRPISVNNVNEFDPCSLPDGRILFGRWEYVDKTALTQQSLWTVFPDGTNETALFANNMVRPEALLDARPVPGESHLVVATLTRHNAPPRGSIAFVDTLRGKNGPQAIANIEHPDKPGFDQGESCDPWPLSRDVVLYSGRVKEHPHNAILLADRSGRRIVVHAEPDIDCHSPIPLEPRERPPLLASDTESREQTGRFFVQDIYRGLQGVQRGEVKWLRVIEETSRVTATPGGAYNQTFLISAALAFSAKNFLGLVPVEPDGSAFFEVPAGRAVYLQALDSKGRLVQSMRTFVQAVPGVTRSCIGCHEYKFSTPANVPRPDALKREPHTLRPEAWGSGYLDYPSMVQPILDRHCVRCHGGEEGFCGGLDLSGGWTEHFNISYENLVSRRETQVTAHLIAGIDCMNGTANWSARIFPPRTHGSGSAPLAAILVNGHEGRIPRLSRTERDLLLAWIDTNGVYYGTWDYSDHGCSNKDWPATRSALMEAMKTAGCLRCHGDQNRVRLFENDWFNLERPELSRILRAPLARGGKGLGLGLALCRDRKADPSHQRIHLMRTGGYVHHVLPMEAFKPQSAPGAEAGGDPVVSFASVEDPDYQALLAIIRNGRRNALATPRVDMPGATIRPGASRQFQPPPLPKPLPTPGARVDAESVVHLGWERSARTIGLEAELHRGPASDFQPGPETLLASGLLHRHVDESAPEGRTHYALVLVSGKERSSPIRTSVLVPPPRPPDAPTSLEAAPAPGRVDLRWLGDDDARHSYHVYRARTGQDRFERITSHPLQDLHYSDATAAEGVPYTYRIRAIGSRGGEGAPSAPATAAALEEIKEPLFAASFLESAQAGLYGGDKAPGTLHGKATMGDSTLDLRQGGHATYAHRREFDLTGCISLECWVKFSEEAEMPVVVSCGQWNRAGWFLQRIGAGWRWHVGGIDCDGGKPAPDRWTHLVGIFDGRTARLYQDGHRVAEKTGTVLRTPFEGALHVGQYSGGPAPQYQVRGRISGLGVYGRALGPEEVSASSKGKP